MDIQYLVFRIVLYHHNLSLSLRSFAVSGTVQKTWKWWWVGMGQIFYLYILFPSFIIWFIIMPLDSQRFMWTINFPTWLEAFGLLLLFGSAFFLFRSYKDNSFVSPLVRIQSDRGQKVISTGVYGFVRHPMYLGGIMLF